MRIQLSQTQSKCHKKQCKKDKELEHIPEQSVQRQLHGAKGGIHLESTGDMEEAQHHANRVQAVGYQDRLVPKGRDKPAEPIKDCPAPD